MNRARDQFLAGASLARDQHGFTVSGNTVDHAHEFMHDRAGKDELCSVDLA